jgi:hypothetical protein
MKEMKTTIPKAAQKRVEEDFELRMERDEIKWGTATYRTAQYYYFSGAMIALNGLHPYWMLCIMSGREILKDPVEVQKTMRRFGMTKKQAEKVIEDRK